mgnify:CR=1 FL=1
MPTNGYLHSSLSYKIIHGLKTSVYHKEGRLGSITPANSSYLESNRLDKELKKSIFSFEIVIESSL